MSYRTCALNISEGFTKVTCRHHPYFDEDPLEMPYEMILPVTEYTECIFDWFKHVRTFVYMSVSKDM